MSGGVLFLLLMGVVAALKEMLNKHQQSQRTPGAPPRTGSDGAPGGEVRLPRPTQRPVLPRPEESAQVLLPDDLWAILTGESRPTTSRTPLPAPDVEREEEGWEEEDDDGYDYAPAAEYGLEALEAAADEADTEAHGAATLTGEPVQVRSRDGRELAFREGRELVLRPRAELARREAREIVSYDDEIPTTKERHDAFHRRLEAMDTGAGQREKIARRRAARRRQLQRAIIMREVLGPPRGLEDGF